jgi:hypothetical protein
MNAILEDIKIINNGLKHFIKTDIFKILLIYYLIIIGIAINIKVDLVSMSLVVITSGFTTTIAILVTSIESLIKLSKKKGNLQVASIGTLRAAFIIFLIISITIILLVLKGRGII